MVLGVSAFLGLEMVLSHFMWGRVWVDVSAVFVLEVVLSSLMWRWVLVDAFAFLGLERVLSAFMWRWVFWRVRLLGPCNGRVSLHVEVGVGWRVCFLGH